MPGHSLICRVAKQTTYATRTDQLLGQAISQVGVSQKFVSEIPVITRKVDAQRWLDNEITAKFATGTYIAPEAGKVTVEEVYKSWERSQGHVKGRTAAARRGAWKNRVAPVWAEVPVVDVKTTAVRAWVATMVADELGVATIETAFGVLRQVLGAALEDNRIGRNPCDGVQLPRRKHADRGYLIHAQVAALAATVEYRPEVVRFLAYTGLRWVGRQRP
jgi:hypothetical protein